MVADATGDIAGISTHGNQQASDGASMVPVRAYWLFSRAYWGKHFIDAPRLVLPIGLP